MIRLLRPRFRLRVPRVSLPKRSITNAFAFSENGIPPPPQDKRRSWKFPALLAGGIAVTYSVWKFITWHNYPAPVAEKLREGLRAEIDGNGKGTKDYNLALERYLEALHLADELGMDKVSDEYTGLQIKISELYEKLGMVEEARMVYRELGVVFMKAISSDWLSSDMRPHLVQRDLRVALKIAMNEAAFDTQLAKRGLSVHCDVATTQVRNRCPELTEEMASVGRDKRFTLQLHDPEVVKKDKKEQYEAWQPFRDELFAARDMYVALCLASGEVGKASQLKLQTTHWMTLAGCDLGAILMSFYNAGAINFLCAEELEVKLNEQEGEARQKSERSAQLSLTNATTCFNQILKHSKELPGKMRHDDPEIAEAQAMSIYGLGVISLHNGELETASEQLREARIRAKACELTDLMNSADLELAKVDQYKSENKKPKTPSMQVVLNRDNVDNSDINSVQK